MNKVIKEYIDSLKIEFMFEKRKHDNFGDKNAPFLFNTSGYAAWREKVMIYIHKRYAGEDTAELWGLLSSGAADMAKVSRIIELLTLLGNNAGCKNET